LILAKDLNDVSGVHAKSAFPFALMTWVGRAWCVWC
jgi:hypothetical protein